MKPLSDGGPEILGAGDGKLRGGVIARWGVPSLKGEELRQGAPDSRDAGTSSRESGAACFETPAAPWTTDGGQSLVFTVVRDAHALMLASGAGLMFTDTRPHNAGDLWPGDAL